MKFSEFHLQKHENMKCLGKLFWIVQNPGDYEALLREVKEDLNE